MSNKTGYAKYTFAFASDIQKLADEKHIKVTLSRRASARVSEVATTILRYLS
jgi:hypothetical protein